MQRDRVLILGAAGRDFHNFNVVFRGDAQVEVVAFTGAQIPRIEGRRYPPDLAGPLYPEGIPIVPEAELERLLSKGSVDRVVMAYSDVAHAAVMHLASRALAGGADFAILGPKRTMLHSRRPVIAVCAVRTGCGKSQTTRYVADVVRSTGLRVAVVRHPMPYGDLSRQRAQRFATAEDLARADCTVEEREEYESHLARGNIVFAGVDYADVLSLAEAECDLVLWDGGNNDLPFYRPDLWITVADPLRPGHESAYHPGEANVRACDVVVVNKVDAAPEAAVRQVEEAVAAMNPRARVVKAASEVTVDAPELVRGQRVLLVEDGPTLTHGEMSFGAGRIAAERFGASEIVDPRPWAVGSIAEAFRRYPHMGALLPALGYYPEQIEELERTIARVPCDTVLVATPIDLGRLLRIDQAKVRVTYELADREPPFLAEIVRTFLDGRRS